MLVKRFIGRCLPCIRKIAHSKSIRHVQRDVMRSTREPYPMGMLYIDTLGPLPESNGLKHILVCKDNFTRFVILAGLEDLPAETIAKSLE